MSLLPALLAMVAVVLAAAGAASIVRDGGLAQSRHADHQLARMRAEAALRRAAAGLGETHAAADSLARADAAIRIDEVASSDTAELADLPLQLLRVTATGESGRIRVRVQADYAIDGCESAHDDPCTPRVRRIAWRELSVE